MAYLHVAAGLAGKKALAVFPSTQLSDTTRGSVRRDVGLQQKTAHDRSTGRPVEGLRLKSTSSVRPLTIANTSTRLLIPSGFRFSAWVNVSAGTWTASSSRLAA